MALSFLNLAVGQNVYLFLSSSDNVHGVIFGRIKAHTLKSYKDCNLVIILPPVTSTVFLIAFGTFLPSKKT
jgi:hypothetical protein